MSDLLNPTVPSFSVQVKLDKCLYPGNLEFNADVYLQDEDGNVVCVVPLPYSLEVLCMPCEGRKQFDHDSQFPLD